MARFYARRAGQDADDLLQEAWIGVIQAWNRLDETIGQPEQFLIRHARWRLLTVARRHRGRMMPPLPQDTPTVDRHLQGVALRADSADACARLAPRHREIVACLQQEMTWRQIGTRLGCTSANIAYHMRQIRARLSNLAPGVDIVSEDKSLSLKGGAQ